MGRRAARKAAAEPWYRRALRAAGRWTGRALLALGAGAVALVVLRWSGVSSSASRWLTLAVVAVVLVSSALASTLPAPPPPPPPAARGPRPDGR
ncbi:hypothetical protein [Cellulomonas oligotrophica]|uniref:Putative anti-sigma-YlaC factor YlaD n=1 Tax=Cellulomonas oligotrophica TaxID=931536 RepID=A0A7Y9FIF7_9CELL|nr:hypothetical protein [Cellulomonas oligotrophica]NYD87941.1 putative anti-sigma-YlaC factor YlaD [Cellulomonas oligotrophica]GIG32851.1 hypothetical protein Col01nite_20100 [Cellulomonas oligotrophica]